MWHPRWNLFACIAVLMSILAGIILWRRPAIGENTHDRMANLYTELARYEWELRWSSFVSDRPDLTSPDYLSNPDQVFRDANMYLTIAESRILDIPDRRVAWREGSLLMRLRLPTRNMQQLLRGQTRLSTPARTTLRQLLSAGGVWSSESQSGADDAFHGFGFLLEYPFNRLTWWPPADMGDSLSAYEGRTEWEGDVPRGTEYYLFADAKSGIVYIVGH